ncbi:MAG: enoyl-CoA hydratase-related protein [Hyphomonadaceae bacterium]|nr:enoyl-CoA hydratase-related protein [Hyphomonadaceae bacterium]
MDPTVLISHRDQCCVLTLSREKALNALSGQVLDELETALDAIPASARALVVTGAGSRAFCAGADVAGLSALDRHAHRRNIDNAQRLFQKISDLYVPSIAAINGYAFGGGLELALACTFRVGSRRAKMGLPEIKLGLIPGYGGTQRLPRLIGVSRALELIMSGRTVEAEEAGRLGLLDRVTDADVLDVAFELARSFTGYSLPALHLVRGAVARGMSVPLHEGLAIEADAAELAFGLADAREGMVAFVEKRAPKFIDG